MNFDDILKQIEHISKSIFERFFIFEIDADELNSLLKIQKKYYRPKLVQFVIVRQLKKKMRQF